MLPNKRLRTLREEHDEAYVLDKLRLWTGLQNAEMSESGELFTGSASGYGHWLSEEEKQRFLDWWDATP